MSIKRRLIFIAYFGPALLFFPLGMAVTAFAGRIPEQDRGFLDRFLLYDVAVAGWTQATPAKRIVALRDADVVGMVTVEPQRGWMSHVGDFRVVVQPDGRGHGVGAGLIERGIELGRSLQGKIVTNDFNLNKVAQLRGETGARLLCLGGREADRDEQGAHEQGDEHDRQSGGGRPGEGFEQGGEPGEGAVGGVEEGGEGREGEEIHRSVRS